MDRGLVKALVQQRNHDQDVVSTYVAEIFSTDCWKLNYCHFRFNPSMAKVFPGTQMPKLGSLLTRTVFTDLIHTYEEYLEDNNKKKRQRNKFENLTKLTFRRPSRGQK